jgi:hypothetical protein
MSMLLGQSVERRKIWLRKGCINTFWDCRFCGEKSKGRQHAWMLLMQKWGIFALSLGPKGCLLAVPLIAKTGRKVTVICRVHTGQSMDDQVSGKSVLLKFSVQLLYLAQLPFLVLLDHIVIVKELNF